MTRLLAGNCFNSWQGQVICVFLKASRLTLVPTQPPLQWVFFLALFCGLGHMQHESNHSPASSAETTLQPSWYALLHSYNKSQQDALFL